jgi:protein phosphatase
VTRALTGTPGLEVEVAENFQLDLADRLLLCSDGLTTVLSDEAIATVLTGDLGLQNVCEELIRQANEQGGPDNITVVLIDVDAL